jgi:hypothetical protein
MVKTFFDDSGAGGKPRPIETRIIRRVGTENDLVEYDYFVYEWKADSSDADLLLDDRAAEDTISKDVKITINRMVNGTAFKLNNGQPFDHTLPSRQMCGDCHFENGNTYQTFVGFDEIRLNSKVGGAAKTQLQEFGDMGIFMKPVPANPRTIQESDPNLLKAKRFILGNCVHCHNENGKVFNMAPEVFTQNTVKMPTMAQSVEPPAGWLRIVPGDPEKSVVFVQARRTPLPMPNAAGGNRLRPMPPVGVNDLTPDPEGIAALKTWIMSLPK